MRRSRVLSAVAGIALAALVAVPATAQAVPLEPGQQQICWTDVIPAGHYVVAQSQETLPGCTNDYGVPASPGYTSVVAPVPPPVAPLAGCLDGELGYLAFPGYAVTSVNNTNPACGYYVAPLSPGHTITYTPLTGGVMDVCTVGGIPAGYQMVPNSERSSMGACGDYGFSGPSQNDLITIQPV